MKPTTNPIDTYAEQTPGIESASAIPQIEHESSERTKCCTACGQVKRLDEFNKHRAGRFGLQSQCKVCRRAHDAAIRRNLKPVAYKCERHGHFKSRTYNAWSAMIQRCTNPSDKHWPDYGGRGIRVCKRWRNSFSAFLSDLGECPRGLSLDRIDNNGHYEPDNCRWTDTITQNGNRRTARLFAMNGKVQCIAAWARELGISESALRRRLKASLYNSQMVEVSNNASPS